MKKGQVNFSEEKEFNTFGKNKSVIYSVTKGNKLNNSIVLIGDSVISSYYKGVAINRNLTINDMISITPSGVIKFL